MPRKKSTRVRVNMKFLNSDSHLTRVGIVLTNIMHFIFFSVQHISRMQITKNKPRLQHLTKVIINVTHFICY